MHSYPWGPGPCPELQPDGTPAPYLYIDAATQTWKCAMCGNKVG